MSLTGCRHVFSSGECAADLSILQEFFKNLGHWVDQHATMNDAGSFLIETCDDTVSLELKQQLLLMNGRWRELFVQVKQVKSSFSTVKVKQNLRSGG